MTGDSSKIDPFAEAKLAGARVSLIPVRAAVSRVVESHYLHRRPPISHAFGIVLGLDILGVVTLGHPPSRHLQVSACRLSPSSVIELNRVWIHDDLPKNTGSWFISRALKILPPLIVVSYADTAVGHEGFLYRACNFNYAGWTDMDRKTPRFDYVVSGKHSRAAFRTGNGALSEKVRRKPKHKYWITTGNRRERQRLAKICDWPIVDYKSPAAPHKREDPAPIS